MWCGRALGGDDMPGDRSLTVAARIRMDGWPGRWCVGRTRGPHPRPLSRLVPRGRGETAAVWVSRANLWPRRATATGFGGEGRRPRVEVACGPLECATVEGRPEGQTGPPSFDRLRKDERPRLASGVRRGRRLVGCGSSQTECRSDAGTVRPRGRSHPAKHRDRIPPTHWLPPRGVRPLRAVARAWP